MYTGVGALVWLPDVAGWARVVAELLRPGGRLFIRDGLTVTALREHTECEWRALRHMVEGPDGKFHLAEMPERLPTMFTLEARKEPG